MLGAGQSPCTETTCDATRHSAHLRMSLGQTPEHRMRTKKNMPAHVMWLIPHSRRKWQMTHATCTMQCLCMHAHRSTHTHGTSANVANHEHSSYYEHYAPASLSLRISHAYVEGARLMLACGCHDLGCSLLYPIRQQRQVTKNSHLDLMSVNDVLVLQHTRVLCETRLVALFGYREQQHAPP